MSNLIETTGEVMDVLFAVKQRRGGIVELTFIDSDQNKVTVPINPEVARDLCDELADLGFSSS